VTLHSFGADNIDTLLSSRELKPNQTQMSFVLNKYRSHGKIYQIKVIDLTEKKACVV
jgi:hypothetical protein